MGLLVSAVKSLALLVLRYSIRYGSFEGVTARRKVFRMYDAHSDSKYSFAVRNPSKVWYKVLLLSDSTFFKLFFHIFAAIIEVLIVAVHKFLYTLLIECGRLRC